MNQVKSEGVAIILAVLVGLISFYGVGHMYVGRIRRGLVILFLDWVISISGVFSLLEEKDVNSNFTRSNLVHV